MKEDTRPNFFIVGAPKCGTTAWVEYLGTHPDIFFSADKEPHHFNTDLPGFRWFRDRDEYEALFSSAGGHRVRAEASVNYLFSREAAGNIAAYAPDARILILLRPQEAFLRSYHNQMLLNRDETRTDFDRLWSECLAGRPRTPPRQCREPAMLDYAAVGRFDEQVARYRDAFPEDRVLVMHFDEWVRDARAAYLRILSFLELPDDGRTEFPRVHPAKRHRSQRIGDLTQRPPRWAQRLSRTARSVGVDFARPLLRKLREGNTVEAPPPPLSPETVESIRRYYAGESAQRRGERVR